MSFRNLAMNISTTLEIHPAGDRGPPRGRLSGRRQISCSAQVKGGWATRDYLFGAPRWPRADSRTSIS